MYFLSLVKKIYLFCVVTVFLFCGSFFARSDIFFDHLLFEEVVGLVDPSEHPSLVRVPGWYTVGSYPIYVRQELLDAFVPMAQAAAASGVNLRIRSGWRGFDEQVQLFKRYGLHRALPPGTSSHHYGNAIDIAYITPQGSAHRRLQQHGPDRGFCQTYDGISSGQGAESRHYEYKPEIYRGRVVEYWETIYAYLQAHYPEFIADLSKQELFDRYIYPISHGCIDSYPSFLDGVIGGVTFQRILDSSSPDHLIYTLSFQEHRILSGLVHLLPEQVRFKKNTSLLMPVISGGSRKIHDFFDLRQGARSLIERLVVDHVYTKIREIGG